MIDKLPEIFGEIWTPEAVNVELMVGDKSGYDVPNRSDFSWLRIIEPAWGVSSINYNIQDLLALAGGNQ